MFRFIYELLKTPSAFRGRPWAYGRNQFLHGYAIGGLPVYLWPEGLPIFVAFYISWEQIQLLWYNGELSDGMEDFAHFMTIALAVYLHQPALMLVQLLFLAAGILFRYEEKWGGNDKG